MYSMNDLAKRWGVSYWAIYDLVHEGKIQFFKVGRQYRFTEEMVLAYENKNHTKKEKSK